MRSAAASSPTRGASRSRPEGLHELPARLAARAAVGARIAAVLDAAVVGDRERVDAAAALHEPLGDARALGGAEDPLLAHRADGRLGDLHLGPAHALLGAQAKRDLLLERHVDGVPLHVRGVMAGRGRDRGQLDARCARARRSRARRRRLGRPRRARLPRRAGDRRRSPRPRRRARARRCPRSPSRRRSRPRRSSSPRAARGAGPRGSRRSRRRRRRRRRLRVLRGPARPPVPY